MKLPWPAAVVIASSLFGAITLASAEVIVTVSEYNAAMAASPFPTVAEAQHHVRALRAAGVSGEIVIDIGPGTHAPIKIGANDSGLNANARTIYRGHGPNTRISGGTEIPPALFKPSSSSSLLVADITSLGLDPANFGEIMAASCIHTCATTRAMLSFNDEEMTLARWPNFDRKNGWNVYTHLASGETGSFVVTPDNGTTRTRMLNWAKGGWLHGYWEWDWADCYRKIESIVLSVAMWEVRIAGQEFSPTVGVNGTEGDLFRVRTVASGGPDDPRHGDCKRDWGVATTNVLEQTHDNKTWTIVAPLACGNTWQRVANATFVPAGKDVVFSFSPADTTPKQNARFYATNLLSELDQPGEFYFEVSGSAIKVHMIPPEGYPTDPIKWPRGPVIGLKDPVVDMSGSQHTTLQDLQVLHGRGVGVLAKGVMDVQILRVNSSLHTRQGIWMDGVDSSITNCSISAVGCAGIRAHGGEAASLTRGNLSVTGNYVHSFARWKRTYQAGIHWAGVGNSYSHNTVTDGPHNCFLGGGNEADANSTVAGVDCLFQGNTLDRCAYEAADTGAFYTCGQSGTAFVNRGNSIVDSIFKNVRNTVGTGVQTAGVQAIYLDDQMSGWNVTNNRFLNCQTGSFIGGGRRNTVTGNYYENCDTAQHLDNRGMTGQAGSTNCSTVCEPLSSGCNCNTGAAEWMVNRSAAANEWGARFPSLKTIRIDRLGQPAYNTITGNTYCKCGKFIDASQEDSDSWGSRVGGNVEVKTCQ